MLVARTAIERLADLDARNSEWQRGRARHARHDARSRSGFRPGRRPCCAPPRRPTSTSRLPAAWARLVTVPPATDLTRLADHLEAASPSAGRRSRRAPTRRAGRARPPAGCLAAGGAPLSAWLAQALEAQTDEGRSPNLKAAEKWLKDASADIRAAALRADRGRGDQELGRAAPAEQRRARAGSSSRARDAAARRRRRRSRRRRGRGARRHEPGRAARARAVPVPAARDAGREPVPVRRHRRPGAVDGSRARRRPRARAGAVAKTVRSSCSRTTIGCPRSTRRLGIDATIIEVTRHEDSVIDLRESLDPVERNLDDAGALVNTKAMPVEMAQEVVPALCRSAIEAAAIEVVRRRRIGRGESHYAVDGSAAKRGRPRSSCRLALWDEGTGRRGDEERLQSLGRRTRRRVETAFTGRTAAIAGRLMCWFVTRAGCAPRSPPDRQ